MSISPFDSFQSRFVTYLFNCPGTRLILAYVMRKYFVKDSKADPPISKARWGKQRMQLINDRVWQIKAAFCEVVNIGSVWVRP
jgi:hypothetical protein